jgi:hypothetical protein
MRGLTSGATDRALEVLRSAPRPLSVARTALRKLYDEGKLDRNFSQLNGELVYLAVQQ